MVGSGSTYVYGYCDATYREGWGRDETLNFVKNSSYIYQAQSLILTCDLALALAMSRDGSSGGTIRMCVITEGGVERHFIPGNELPRFWEGKEVLSNDTVSAVAPVTMVET
jgi:20S proteasome subunit beta 1